MKIAIDCRMINSSGIGTYLKNIIEIFVKNNYFEILCMGNHNELSQFNWFSKIKFIEIKSQIFTICEQFELFFKIPKCDIYWSPQYNIPLLFIKAKKRVVTIHDVYHLAFKKEISIHKRFYSRLMIELAARISDKIITVSDFSNSEILKYTRANKDKIEVVKNGVDKNFNKNYKFRKINKKYILYVGNVKPHKNLINAIKSYLKLQKKYKDLYFYIIGKKDGFITPDNDIDKIYKGFEEKIIFTGKVDIEILKNYYANASLFIFPSLYEGFGLPILEAMMFDIPIISSSAASLSEVGGDSIEYFDPHDIDDIADKIDKAITLKLNKKQIHSSYSNQLKNFNWEISADLHYYIFSNLINQKVIS